MPLFRESFRPHIKQELEYRRTHKGRQDVFSPVVRVTSLVQGELYGNTIRGLTLGLSDYRESSLDSLTNISGKGSAIGTTYVDHRSSTVFVSSKENLPSPGVTDVSISTQSKGGLVFKAQVNFKFYGKEQYDFLYQTFMRPGTPILLEYGHLRTNYDDIKTKSDVDNTVNLLRDLKFFKDLQNVTPYEEDLYQTAKLVANRESGAVVGLVSNFKTSLNENNEYEATIDLINALEYMFTLPTEDTFLSFGENVDLSNSIRANFGEMDDLDYDEKYDRVFQYILRDTGQNFEGDDKYFMDATSKNFKEFINLGYVSSIQNAQDLAARTNNVEGSGYEIEPSAIPLSDESYINFIYFLNKILPIILFNTVKNSENCDGQADILFRTGAQISSLTQFVTGTATDNRGESVERPRRVEQADIFTQTRINTSVNNDFYNTMQEMHESDNFYTVAYFEPPRHIPTLRSIRLKDVIINNENLYTDFEDNKLWQPIVDGYLEKFDLPTELTSARVSRVLRNSSANRPAPVYDLFFRTSPQINLKKQYKQNKTFDGIFINYNLIRNSFLNSNSVSEALIKILNKINSATSGIYDLKLRYHTFNSGQINSSEEFSDGSTFSVVLPREDISVFTIYDANNYPKKDEIVDLYTFFENDISEALSYNFDFSLPQSVASTVIADTFRDDTRNIVGDASTYQLFRNGYLTDDEGNPLITPLIGSGASSSEGQCDDGTDDFFKVKPIQNEFNNTLDTLVDFFKNLGFVESEAIQRARQVTQSEGENFKLITAYKEFNPPVMKAEAINQGMLNTIPTSAKVTIKLVGLDGFRFGDMFTVRNMLPDPYDENNVFMLTGYKHTINSDGWITEIDGIMIATTLEENYPRAVREVRDTESPRAYGRGSL